MTPDWKIFYSDSSTFDSLQGEPRDAPSYGFVCAVYADEVVGRVIMHGWDWYYWRTDHEQWWGSDIHGLLDNLLHNQPITAIKQGRNIHNTEYKKIWALMINDPDFPVKSGQKRGENP